MKKYNYFFGVDVSKHTVDISCIINEKITHKRFGNDPGGMQELLQWVQELEIVFEEALFCMESTGLYCFPLTSFLTSNQIDIWIENAVQIKKSSGIIRGKSDKVDSARIAVYATKHLDRLRLWKPMDITLQKIKHLAALRERLVNTQKRLTIPIKEFEDVGNTEMAKLLNKTIKSSLVAIDKDLKKVESKIIAIINEDDNLKNLYQLITSVVGIGFVTAVNLLIYTNGFTMMKDARQLSSYCGVAPFPYTSGTTIKGRTRVHPMSNKKLKVNLHMAALTAVKFDVELKNYYERKAAEGKNKMSVLNAVKNKLLARVVAVVNKQKLYVRKAA